MVVVGGLRAWWSGRVCEEVLRTDPLRIARQGDNAVTLSVCIHCSFLLRSVSFAPPPHHHHLFATIHVQTDSNTECGSELHFRFITWLETVYIITDNHGQAQRCKMAIHIHPDGDYPPSRLG